MKFVYKKELDDLIAKLFGVKNYKLGINNNIICPDEKTNEQIVPVLESKEEYGEFWVEYPDVNKMNCQYAIKYANKESELAIMWSLAEKRLQQIEKAKKININGDYNLIVNNTPQNFTVAALVVGDELARSVLIAYDKKRNLFNDSIYDSVNVKETLTTGKGIQPGDQ